MVVGLGNKRQAATGQLIILVEATGAGELPGEPRMPYAPATQMLGLSSGPDHDGTCGRADRNRG